MLIKRFENLKSNLNEIHPSFEESTLKTWLTFTRNITTWLPSSPYPKKDDVQPFWSITHSQRSLFIETQAFVENEVELTNPTLELQMAFASSEMRTHHSLLKLG